MDKYTEIIKTMLNGYKRIKIASVNNSNEIILYRMTEIGQKVIWYHFKVINEVIKEVLEINSYISIIINKKCYHRKQKRSLIKL